MPPKTKYVLKGAVIGTVVGVWFLSFLAPVVGALIALWRWNKKQAVEKKEAAEATAAAIQLGCRYYNGDGVGKDLRKAFGCWSENVESLDAETALKLADMYRDGEVTEKDLKKAFQLYQKVPRQDAEPRIMEIFEQGVNLPEYARYAAESYTRRFENGEEGLVDKLIALYTSLGDGENLKKYQIIAAQKGDRTLAAKWGKELFKTDKVTAYPLLCSADGNSDPEIPFMLASILETGDGAAADLSAAKKYYQMAMDAGYEPASRHLAPLLLKSSEKSELEQAFSMYRAWADNGDADAKFEVAEMLAQGIGTAPDATGALAMWQELAETGCHAALPKIAEAYHTGSGCERNLSQAMEFADRAVRAKVKGAKKLLDELKAEKDAEIRAEKEAILNAAVAACENDATGEAELQVARLYEAGKVAQKSPKKALEYYQKAAEKGNAEALFRLGKIAEDGNSALRLRPDIARALELYERAGKRGSGEAEKALESIREKIANFEQKIIEYARQFKQYELLDSSPMEYIEHEIPHSWSCGLYVYGSITNSVKSDTDFTEIYRNSSDIKEMAIGFIHADFNHDNENCWFYAEKLIDRGVYWPLWGFQDVDDDESPLSYICAMKMHGCLEAVFMFDLYQRIRQQAESNLPMFGEKAWKIADKQAKAIDAKWLRARASKTTFPSVVASVNSAFERKGLSSEPRNDEFDDSGNEIGTAAGASGLPEFYSYNDLDEASQSKDSEINNWATWRLRLVQTSIDFMWHFDVGKDKRIACLKTWLDLTGNILTERYARLGGFCPGVHQDRIGFFYMFTYKRLQDLGYDCNLIPLNEKFRRDLQCQHAFREQCEDLTHTYKEMGCKSYMSSLACYLLGDEKILSDELLAPLQKIVNISFLE